MACVLAIQHWRPYLLGRKFVVLTDQRSLKDLLQQKIITGEQQNWIAKLLGFNFDIRYKPGKLNQGADALSRIQEEGEFNNFVSYPVWEEFQQVQQEIQADEKIKKIWQDLSVDPTTHPEFSIQHGTLLYKGRLVMSSQSALIPRMLKEFHSSPQGGHSEGSIDRNHVTEDETNEVMIYHHPNGPKVWRVYSRRGKKGKEQ
ncbi:unnamed protein product [Vicia faba]|uniref:Reverse transcriptase RNase H-like domain-containing protein n=1 Tax=Vicia faba TaxID=3906 RepID=A0AAV0YNQ5_VICFA|nr:unnamed protein product [Vicia faba]